MTALRQTLCQTPIAASPDRCHLGCDVCAGQVLTKSGIHQFSWEAVGEDVADLQTVKSVYAQEVLHLWLYIHSGSRHRRS